MTPPWVFLGSPQNRGNVAKFITLQTTGELPLAVATDCDLYLHDRLELWEAQLTSVNRMAAANDLPDPSSQNQA